MDFRNRGSSTSGVETRCIASLPERQDMVTWRYVLPFRQQLWCGYIPEVDDPRL
ncbi:MAG: hypothetical protein LBK22_02030 [Tannerella sp.]|nr:hypothetical protein [Tannerella sp.]